MTHTGTTDIRMMTTNTPNPFMQNQAHAGDRIALPIPPAPHIGIAPDNKPDTRFELEVYARFMRHLRDVPNSRMDIKILAAIGFTADMMDVGDAMVAKTLVDMGLRAPRRAFPHSFLEFADRTQQRSAWDHTSTAPDSLVALQTHWNAIGEDRFASASRTDFVTVNEFFPT